MKHKILHICERSTFINDVIKNYEQVFPGQNVFLVNTDKRIPFNGKDNIVEKDGTIILKKYRSSSYQKFIENFERKYFLVIFHNIGHQYKRKLVKRMFDKVPMHAILWGWEIYEDPKFNRLFFKDLTFDLIHSYKKSINETIINLKAIFRGNAHVSTISKMSSLSTILKSEYSFLKEEYGVKVPYLPHNYSKIANVFTTYKKVISGTNILIGNSGTPSNNHLDIIHHIPISILKEDAKLYLPMSYGPAGYTRIVESSFRKYFKEKVIFLKEFVSLDNYNNLIKSCGFVIMYQIRQQGLGNVYLSLWNGSKVFLDENSFAYLDLINDGLKVYKIEDFAEEYPRTESLEIVERNRQIIQATRGKDVTLKYIKGLVESFKLK